MMQSENKNQREEQSIVNDHKSDSNTMKAAKITSIASILVAFVLGGFTIFSMYLANRNNIKAINLQNKINTEIAKFESDNRYELQKKDQLYQINQLKKAFTNTIEAIKAEKEASLSIQEKKSKKEKNELFNKSVRHLIININSIISEFDIILSILDNNKNKKIFDKLFLLNNKIQIKSAIEIIKSLTLDIDNEIFDNLNGDISIQCIYFFNQVNRVLLLSEMMFNQIGNDSIDTSYTTIELQKKIFNVNDKELLSILIELHTLNIELTSCLIAKGISGSIITGINALQSLEKISNDKSLKINKGYIDNIKSKSKKIADEYNNIKSKIKKLGRPIFEINQNNLINFAFPAK